MVVLRSIEEVFVYVLRFSMAFMLLICSSSAFSRDQTVGLFLNLEDSFEGYTVFAPLAYETTYLIDHDGLLVNSWESEYTPGNAAYFLDDGTLLRTMFTGVNPVFEAGGSGGGVQQFDWEGNLIWEYHYSSSTVHQHHDIEALPNGNVLIIAWEYKSRAEAIQAGRSPDLLSEDALWPDHVIEVRPTGPTTGEIVWEWHVWDHLVQDFDPSKDNYGVVGDHPELIDINFVTISGPNPGKADWNHTNGVDYNDELDQIVLSVRAFSELWVIDHSTTTAEAAGHSGGNSGKGGDLLYRWGNPEAYQAGDESDRKFYGQHDSQWIASGFPGDGNILTFNNGGRRPEGSFSTVDEIVPPVNEQGDYAYTPGEPYAPEEQIWIYMAENPEDFFSRAISGAERMPNGNTLICSGNWGTFFEVTPAGEIVWLYINPVVSDGPIHQGEEIPEQPHGNGTFNMVFKIRRYAPDFPGFEGHDLTPGDPIELDPISADYPYPSIHQLLTVDTVYPNPFSANTTLLYTLNASAMVSWSISDLCGRVLYSTGGEYQSSGDHVLRWYGRDMNGGYSSNGVYIMRISAHDDSGNVINSVKRLVLNR